MPVSRLETDNKYIERSAYLVVLLVSLLRYVGDGGAIPNLFDPFHFGSMVCLE